jgi:hypothetical protein
MRYNMDKMIIVRVPNNLTDYMSIKELEEALSEIKSEVPPELLNSVEVDFIDLLVEYKRPMTDKDKEVERERVEEYRCSRIAYFKSELKRLEKLNG